MRCAADSESLAGKIARFLEGEEAAAKARRSIKGETPQRFGADAVKFVVRAGVETYIKVDDPAHPMHGFALFAPKGAATRDFEIVARRNPAPAPLRPEAVSAGVENVGSFTVLCGAPGAPCLFARPVALTVPYAPPKSGTKGGAAMLVYDPVARRYETLQVVDTDEKRRLMTFLTSSISAD